MLTVATMILCGEATDSRLNWLLPLIVAGGRHRRIPHGRSESPLGSSPRPGQLPGPGDPRHPLPRVPGRSLPAHRVPRALGHLPSAHQVLPSQDRRGRLVPFRARADRGLDRVGDQPGRHGRRLAAFLGDAGRLGPGPVLPPARGPPVSERVHRRGPFRPAGAARIPITVCSTCLSSLPASACSR